MKGWYFILRNLRNYAWSHGGVLAGVVVAGAVLTGALSVGDSVRGSLRQLALARLGSVEFALPGQDRFFRQELAEELETRLDRKTAGVLAARGVMRQTEGTRRANRVDVYGVETNFWELALEPSQPSIAAGEVGLNEALAERLQAEEGDTVLLRLVRPELLSRDALLSPQEDVSVVLRVKVGAIVGDRQFGRFGLGASQLPPFNAFVSRDWLQERLEQPESVNLLLIGTGEKELTLESVQGILRNSWRLEDAQLELKPLPDERGLELRSSRVFLEDPIIHAVGEVGVKSQGVLTWFVNRLEVGDRSTPYSMVTAALEPLTPSDLEDDEIVLNQWLADDLDAAPGDRLKLSYYSVGDSRELIEEEAEFTVHSVVPLSGPWADPGLMPEFPGLKDAESCRDWDAGFPIDLDAVRDKDNRYWEEHRGTPKAFISPQAGAQLWHNRFGSLTAVRFAVDKSQRSALHSHLANAIDPASLGLSFYPVREQAFLAVAGAQDFGGLFIGFSFFLILAGLLLISLLFQFSLERRQRQTGTLLALGLPPRQVKRFWNIEGGAVAGVGALWGAVCGVLYAQAMLYGLKTIWQEAIGTAAIDFHHSYLTLIFGAAGGFAAAWVTIWLGVRVQTARPARELLTAGSEQVGDEFGQGATGRKRLASFAFFLSVVVVAWAANVGPGQAVWFFCAGGLILLSGLSAASWWLRSGVSLGQGTKLNLTSLGIRGGSRRIKRSLAVIGLVACGSFLVAAVGANKLDVVKGANARSSGTGGFRFWGETTQSVTHDLNSSTGREFYLLDDEELSATSFVPFRVLPGEDVSCLNLNRAQQPRLLGVDPVELAGRRAFTFASVLGSPLEGVSPWSLLEERRPDGAVPAIMDQNSMLWALGKQLGDTLTLVDGRGEALKIVLVGAVANSILQGFLIIDESRFVERFPRLSGYRAFLIDSPPAEDDAVERMLGRALEDAGLELTRTERRLAAFNAVQNTYLSTFQLLGGLGLLLGSVGLGVVVMRNIRERRRELALLNAVGIRKSSLRWLVLSEHGILLLAGLTIGVVSALLATLPAWLSPGAEIPYGSLGLTLAAVLVNGLFWTWLATRLALRGSLLEALHDE